PRPILLGGALIGRENAGELAERLLVALIGDLGEVARQFQAHPFARADGASAFALQPVKEVTDRNANHLRDLIEAPGGNAIDPTLVFVRLLISHSDQIRELLLGETQHDAALANTGADMAVDVLRPTGRTARYGGAIGHGLLAVIRLRFAGLVGLLHLAHSISCNFFGPGPAIPHRANRPWNTQPIPSG